MNTLRVIIMMLAVIVGLEPTMAQCTPAMADTAKVDAHERFGVRQLILPISLMGVGYFGVHNGWLRKVNDHVNDGMADIRGTHFLHFDNWAEYTPLAAYIGLGFLPGVKAKNDFKTRLVAGATAFMITTVITQGAKRTVHEWRPDGSDNHSFPSGHTAVAFLGAELMRIEYGNWIGAGAYVVATGIGFLRLYNERHWLNDVIAGAGIGILSARAAYWLLPLERRWVHLDGSAQVAAVPYYNPAWGHGGLAINVYF